MPAKQVLQYDCGRCRRVWYVEQNQPEVVTTVAVAANFDGAAIDIKYDCLCEGCKKTVKSLLEAIGKEFKKAAPQRGARKKKEGGEPAKTAAGGEDAAPPPADSPSPLPPKVPSTLSREDSPAARADASAASSGGKGSQPSGNRSIRG